MNNELYLAAKRASAAFEAAGLPALLVEMYGCCRCQKWHYRGQQLFDAHIMSQSKNAWRGGAIAAAIAETC